MSFNQMVVDQPQPQIARSAVILGEVHVRQHQINLTDHPGTVVHRPTRAGEHMGTLYAYRDKTPAIGAGACVKQRDRFGDRSILDGFPATLAGTLTGPPPPPGWALPPAAVATRRRVKR
jgi:hypothetical protein